MLVERRQQQQQLPAAACCLASVAAWRRVTLLCLQQLLQAALLLLPMRSLAAALPAGLEASAHLRPSQPTHCIAAARHSQALLALSLLPLPQAAVVAVVG